MPQIGLERPGIVTVIGQRVPAGVANKLSYIKFLGGA